MALVKVSVWKQDAGDKILRIETTLRHNRYAFHDSKISCIDWKKSYDKTL